MRFLALSFVLALGLAACANRGIDDIPMADAGQVFKIRYGTVVSQHRVSVRTSPQTAISLGVLATGMAGTIAAADHATFVGGAVAGGAVAAVMHYVGELDNAVEYRIMLDNGTLVLIDQIQRDSERVLQPGEAVLVEFGAMTNRVQPMPEVPLRLDPPRRITLKGHSKNGPTPEQKLDLKTCSKAGVGDSTRENCVNF